MQHAMEFPLGVPAISYSRELDRLTERQPENMMPPALAVPGREA